MAMTNIKAINAPIAIRVRFSIGGLRSKNHKTVDTVNDKYPHGSSGGQKPKPPQKRVSIIRKLYLSRRH